MRNWKRAICFCAAVTAMLAVEACQKDSATSPEIPDVSGRWDFKGYVTKNDCVGYFFLPVNMPRIMTINLAQNGSVVTGLRTMEDNPDALMSLWSLADSAFVGGANDGEVVTLQIINSLVAWPPNYTWPGKQYGDVFTAADSAAISCRLWLTGTGTMHLAGVGSRIAVGDSLFGTLSGPVYTKEGDCGAYIAPVPCELMVSGFWYKR